MPYSYHSPLKYTRNLRCVLKPCWTGYWPDTHGYWAMAGASGSMFGLSGRCQLHRSYIDAYRSDISKLLTNVQTDRPISFSQGLDLRCYWYRPIPGNRRIYRKLHHCCWDSCVLSSSQTMGFLSNPVMKEGIDEIHPWVTDDGLNLILLRDIYRIQSRLELNMIRFVKIGRSNLEIGVLK